MTILVRL